MSFLDHIPVVSHVKAGIQLLAGDKDGARRTMEVQYFETPGVSHMLAGFAKLVGEDEVASSAWHRGNDAMNAIPVVGHAKGLAHLAVGDVSGCKKAMVSATKTMGAMADATPGVGHVKGVVHYACGDKEGGHRAMEAATRTTAVMGAGAVGFAIGGPVGAVALGMESGQLWDFSAAGITRDGSKSGLIKLVKNPKDVNNYVNLGLKFVGDGMTGYAGGKVAERINKASEIRTAERLKKLRQDKGFRADDNLVDKPNGKEVYAEVKDLETGKLYDGKNKNVRKEYGDPSPKENLFTKEHRPEIDPKFHRRTPEACAEAQAYDKYVKDNPGGSTINTRLNTIEVRPNGEMYNLPRCKNCMEYAPVVGNCNTDYLLCRAQRIPAPYEYKGAAAVGAAGVVCGICGEFCDED